MVPWQSDPNLSHWLLVHSRFLVEYVHLRHGFTVESFDLDDAVVVRMGILITRLEDIDAAFLEFAFVIRNVIPEIEFKFANA